MPFVRFGASILLPGQVILPIDPQWILLMEIQEKCQEANYYGLETGVSNSR